MNVCALLLPPPPFAVGLLGSTAGPVNTATEAQLSVVSRLAGTVAVNCVAEVNVVARHVSVAPAVHCTREPSVVPQPAPLVEAFTKLEPVTVNVTSGLPGAAMVGAIEVRTGTGFAGTVTMNAIVLERPLSCLLVAGLSVLTKCRPGVAISAGGTLAVTFVALLFASTVTLVSRFLPSHCTTVFGTKPFPITVSIRSGLPAAAAGVFAGEREINNAPVFCWKVLP